MRTVPGPSPGGGAGVSPQVGELFPNARLFLTRPGTLELIHPGMPERATLPPILALGGLGLCLLVVARIARRLPVGRVIGAPSGPRDHVVGHRSGTNALCASDLTPKVRSSQDDATEAVLLGRARPRTTPLARVLRPVHWTSSGWGGSGPRRGSRPGARRALCEAKESSRSRPEESLPDGARRDEDRPGGPSRGLLVLPGQGVT